MNHTNRLLSFTLSIAFLLTGLARAADAPSLDALLTQSKTYKLGDSRAPLEQIQQLVIQAQSNPQQRKDVAQKLAAVLSTDASYECKDFICRQLYIIGTRNEIPAVANLLTDEKLSHMARYVLEAMADSKADDALRKALDKTQGRTQIGIINSLGNRADDKSLKPLRKLLADKDPAVASAAAAALGKIGGKDAIKALADYKTQSNAELKNAMLDAYLNCADLLLKADKPKDAAKLYTELHAADQPARIRAAALRGLVATQPDKTLPILLDMLKSNDPTQQAVAASYARQLPGDAATQAFTSTLTAISPAGQVLLIDALAARGPAVKPAILAALKSSDEPVRIAALKTLGQIGDASDLALLADTAAKSTGPTRDAARDALAKMKGQPIDAAIESILVAVAPDARVELIRALAARGSTRSVPTLLKIAASQDTEPERIAALNALGLLAADKELAAVVERVAAAKSNPERDAARNAVGAICSRIADKDACANAIVTVLQKADPQAKAALVSLLSRVGGSKALAAVRDTQKDPTPAVQEAAIRTLTDWPDPAATQDLLSLVRSENQTHRVLALRGLVRILSPQAAKPTPETLSTYREMLAACTRPEDTRLVLGGLADVKDEAAFLLVLPSLQNDALRSEAATAILKIAKAVGPNKPAAKEALQKVAAANVDQALKQQAQDLLKK